VPEITQASVSDPLSDEFPHLISNRRRHIVDYKFGSDLNDARHYNRLFVRTAAKGRSFTNVDFKYSIFESCYFRDCVFKDCNFTGCKFSSSNFRGSCFSNCKFDYASFDKTFVEPEILENSCPGFENLKLHFARSLRINYQSLGDAASVNRAMALELQATGIHLHKSWSSTEAYYRSKYQGVQRLRMFFRWFGFRFMDLIWGNGESAVKLLRATFALIVVMATIHLFVFKQTTLFDAFRAIGYMPQVLLGVGSPEAYFGWYLALILLIRLILFGLFMSILIKRFSRR
jgi:hypothetical protein